MDFKKKIKGQALIEFVIIVVPIFLILLFISLDFGRYLYVLVSVEQASSSYAKDLNINPELLTDTALQQAEKNNILATYPALSSGVLTILVTPDATLEVPYTQNWADTTITPQDFKIKQTDCSVKISLSSKWLTPISGMFGLLMGRTADIFVVEMTKHTTTNKI